MKALLAAACVMAFTVSAAFASDPTSEQRSEASQPVATPNWTTTFSAEGRYFSWRNSFVPAVTADGSGAPGKGWQFYAPFAMQLSGKPIENLGVDFIARGGWVKSVQSTPDHSGAVQTPTDTVLSGTITYLGLRGMQPFISLNANLPTGKSALFGSSANARMDPDLVDISVFGEGFNLGPTTGFNFPITGSLLVTTSVGYTWRGPFSQESRIANPTNPFATTRVDAGDDLTATVAVNYQTGPFSVGVISSLTWETPTATDGVRTFKAGDRYLLSLQSSYGWSERLGTTSLSASYAHSNRNKILIPGLDVLATEFFDSNSDVYRIGIQHLLPVGSLVLGPAASVLYRNHNGYNADTLQFVPAKTRWAAGALAQFAPSQSVTFNARLERIWIHAAENPSTDNAKLDALAGGVQLLPPVPAISGTGWQTSLGINFKL